MRAIPAEVKAQPLQGFSLSLLAFSLALALQGWGLRGEGVGEADGVGILTPHSVALGEFLTLFTDVGQLETNWFGIRVIGRELKTPLSPAPKAWQLAA